MYAFFVYLKDKSIGMFPTYLEAIRYALSYSTKCRIEYEKRY